MDSDASTFFHKFKIWSSGYWNLCDATAILLFFVAFALRLAGFEGALTAGHVCTFAHHLVKMGHPEAEPYALSPSSQTGKFQRKLDSVFGFDQIDDSLYEVPTPVRDVRTGRRKRKNIFAQPAHEALLAELDARVGLLETWQDKLDEAQEWIQAYEQHPLVAGASLSERKKILPVCIYMDGAEYNRKDGLIVFTARWSFSRRRHLVWAVRKSNVCNCSCGGWCTLYPLFQFVRWSVAS